jgi:hypothetical protein
VTAVELALEVLQHPLEGGGKGIRESMSVQRVDIVEEAGGGF